MRRLIRRVLKVSLVAGMGYAAYRVFNNQAPGRYEPLTAPPPPPPAARWVEPDGNGACPPSHPVKAKVESGIFHVEGGRYYDRITPDRCYSDAQSAQSDGLRPSKQ